MRTHGDLLREIEDLAVSTADSKTLMQRVADHLHAVLPRYNNIIFRLVEDSEPGVLLLGPYTGSFNPRLKIPFEHGLCGAAATERRTIVVDDVTTDGRYLSGSSMVKSEIVVPIFVRGNLAAEIDVQSYFADTFRNSEERQFVEACAGVMAKHMEQSRKKVQSPP